MAAHLIAPRPMPTALPYCGPVTHPDAATLPLLACDRKPCLKNEFNDWRLSVRQPDTSLPRTAGDSDTGPVPVKSPPGGASFPREPPGLRHERRPGSCDLDWRPHDHGPPERPQAAAGALLARLRGGLGGAAGARGVRGHRRARA